MKGLLGRLITRVNLRSCSLLTKPYAQNGSLSTSRRFLYALSSKTPYVFSDFTSLKPSQFPSSSHSLWSQFGGKLFILCQFLVLFISESTIGIFWIFLAFWDFYWNILGAREEGKLESWTLSAECFHKFKIFSPND